ncbi:hypothetical protein EUGRSUZ_B01686 [Eucalyptus grandis]|uniref:Uncharacterized protein n=1 Tax=Eucalyptus grandis TaxID=71139 RepID=A0ACC3LR41_EUCGR|nr:hypothetical protein EUGRSUZ_B01686 [Eucalyptus grandis]
MSSSKLSLILHLMMGLLSISGASDRSVPKTTIYVDKSGSGNYSSVQEAIDSIPDDNNQWIHILIKRGTYRLTWAPAALLVADKVSFHRCGFHGIQDTLGDAQGRHYFEKCYISGAIDFIWGHGQSVYKTTASTIGQDGYITAQGRQGADDPSAFVFIRCWVKGEGHTYLGRAYRRYSRVLFYHTRMTEVVVPAGWSSWNYRGHEEDITFAEVRCTGEGASKSGRVKWMKDLPSQEVQYFLSNDFISQDGWLKNQPRYIEIQTPRY